MTRLTQILTLLLFLFSSQPVLAHAKMAESVPADGAILNEVVSVIELMFSMPTRLTIIEIEQSDSDKVFTVTNELPPSFIEKAQIPIDPLGAGAYEVHWTAVAKDGHVMKGDFSFTVKDETPPAGGHGRN